MKMSIGEANSSCIDNEMLLKAINPDNDRSQSKMSYKLVTITKFESYYTK